ncbi:GNAT family N-acetyltransferase [Elizabethkingia sp. JS20170427COW]|uniref:GNAT family N-acetyltransferase n=1 Tax=Elizabethkingia sp. JS20170427COW TaxID=2583851 RepID=UPI0011107BAB|nr:GNAT family N-acetyltransferase [Elizabethkingia sp. JS20170427COW]QCX53871.1 N-acetyltransferase [Elizabethkingia sp. JS20170427COW]
MLENTEVIAEINYRKISDQLYKITHTEVDPSYGGKGLGKILVGEMVKIAREFHLKLKAECTYAHRVLSSTEEYQDVCE